MFHTCLCHDAPEKKQGSFQCCHPTLLCSAATEFTLTYREAELRALLDEWSVSHLGDGALRAACRPTQALSLGACRLLDVCARPAKAAREFAALHLRRAARQHFFTKKARMQGSYDQPQIKPRFSKLFAFSHLIL